MVAEADCIHQSIPVLDVPYRCIAKEIEEIVDTAAVAVAAASMVAAPSSPVTRQAECGLEAAPSVADVAVSQLDPFCLWKHIFRGESVHNKSSFACVVGELEAWSSAICSTFFSGEWSIGSPSMFDLFFSKGKILGQDGLSYHADLRTSDSISNELVESLQFVPSIRSGSFADIGPRSYMEDEHIRIDDLSAHLGSLLMCPAPSAFYVVFDGHGGPDAAAYIRRHALRFLFEDARFPQAVEANDDFVESVENSVRESFLLADLALAEDCTISSSSGTTALAAMVFGRHLLVANAGDCRAVLCRKGEAVDMSQDHRPIYEAERQRVEQSGGFIDDGYLNGVLSVTRALGDWDLKMPRGSPAPLIAEPEFKQAILTEDDEFLIIGCDGIWDVMSSQHAVSIVRRGLRRHDDPERCARELVAEALRLNTFDNLTVIVVCFSDEYRGSSASPPDDPQQQTPLRLKCCKSLSAEALFNLRSWLENSGGN